MVFSRIFLALDNAVESNFRNTQIVRFAVAAILLLGTGYLNRALATHNRAGEITYTHVSGLTYEIQITTYTKSTAPADRPFLYLYWGDEN